MFPLRVVLAVLASLTLAVAHLLSAKPPQKVDLFGDPLPQGAIARIGTARLRHGGGVFDLAYSPAGKDHTVRLWDVAAGKELGVLEGHRGAVCALAFSRDSKLLATGGDDTTTVIWDVAGVFHKK